MHLFALIKKKFSVSHFYNFHNFPLLANFKKINFAVVSQENHLFERTPEFWIISSKKKNLKNLFDQFW